MTEDRNIGRLVAKRYRLLDLVGKGAMGQVYRAEDILLGGATVAVKFISHALLNEKRRVRFEQEAKICALLGEKSIHIVQVRDYGLDEDGVPFYAMEFLQGKSLSQIIKSRPLELPRFIHLTRQISLGLQCAHVGIFVGGHLCPVIHRDIKPSNILAINDPTVGELVKILDFGIAKMVEADGGQTHSFQGTLAYSSPEQMEGKELDSRSDIYSLGVMMYEMLTGTMPILPETNTFGGWYKAHRYLPPEPFPGQLPLPQGIAELVISCLAKDPNDRPQTLAEVLRELQPPVCDRRPMSFETDTVPLETTTRPYQPRSSEQLEPEERRALLAIAWPNSKPRQKIVFPRLVSLSTGELPALYAMLDGEDIEDRRSSKRYNQFLLLMSPHPMVLWITALYSYSHGPRWLPCYLDLKTQIGQQTVRRLAEVGQYRILLFALESPQGCQHVLSATLAAAQRQRLYDWASASQAWASHAPPQMSKQLLKREFEQLKPRILLKLDASTTNDTNISS